MDSFKINYKKLKGLLTEKEKTYKECSEAIGISETQFGKKINGEVDFWITEVAKLAKFLNLTENEFFAVFVPGLYKE